MISQKCIWMEVGYVDYKLCDRNFDCDNCPFDKAMHEKRINNNNSKPQDFKKYSNGKKFFTKNHLWMENDNNEVSIGLDRFAQKILSESSLIQFPKLRSTVNIGNYLFWLVGSWGAIGFTSPIKGIVSRINGDLKNNFKIFFNNDPLSMELIRISPFSDFKLELKNVEVIGTESEYFNFIRKESEMIKRFLVYENWLKTKHASAYKTLETPKAQEIAKKLKLTNPPTESIECLKCHSIGYFEGEQSIPTNKKEDGVTCEACHGPGSAYKNSHGKGKKEEGIKKGLVLGTNDEKLCKKCHNPQSPTYAGFGYKKDWEKIKH